MHLDKKQAYLPLRNKIADCSACRLRENATQVVPGAGSLNAEIMFIGEGPGATEDKEGLPFVGSAGKFLNELLESIGLSRNKVFITNIVKCRPPNNREPLPDEVSTCAPWLDKQIEIIAPRVFIPLGRHALNRFIPGRQVGNDHGNCYEYRGRVYFISYHPAFALYNGSNRPVLMADFQKLKSFLDGNLEPVKIDDTVSDIIKTKETAQEKKKPTPVKPQSLF
ncbi:uracil-DNA glycosylase [Candidatus Dojkabacteria bacterium]|nr:uracil-DNA glycosylase [Candidatus Dojkabacteria bacterium]